MFSKVTDESVWFGPDQEKKSDTYKKFKDLFSDAELLEVNEKD